MLFKETVASQTLDLIKRFFKNPRLDEFVLVGGTALSLQIGHRVSLDIDLFNIKPFDASAIAACLRSNYGAEHIVILENGVFCFVEDIKVDVLSHQYPWVEIPMDVEV
ncbi:MAG TPA: nucleotidyl transferase AbiEii/AbiGii toxin family protein [Chryseolinea sp.]